MPKYICDTYIFFAFFGICGLTTAFLIWRTKAYYYKLKIGQNLESPAQQQDYKAPAEKKSAWNRFWNWLYDGSCLIFFLILLPITIYATIIGIYCWLNGNNFWNIIYSWKEIIAATYALIFTIYTALYAITWAKYEFEVNRQGHELSILSTLISTDQRKNFVRNLVNLTNEKITSKPQWFSFKQIMNSTLSCFDKPDEIDNRQTIEAVQNIIQGFDDWKKVSFWGINLNTLYFSKANLQRLDFSSANFEESIFRESSFKKTNFSFSNLADTRFEKSNLQKADFYGANLSNAKLIDNDLQESNFSESNLQNADLTNSRVEGALFSDANLKNACLQGLDFGSSDYMLILGDAKSLFGAKLDPDIEEGLRSKYPDLFTRENPEEDID